MLSRRSLATRILALGAAVSGCFLVLLTCLYPTLRAHFMAEKERKTREMTQAAAGVIGHYAALATAGKLPVDQAKGLAMDAVREMKYGPTGKDYFWINDLDLVMRMHPFAKELVGNSVSDMKDGDGKYIFREMVETARRSGEGLVSYQWKKPGEESASPKISYVKLVPEWGWIVGTGVYVDDVQKEMNRLFGVIYGLAGAILAGTLAISWWMSRTIARPIDRMIRELGDTAAQISSGAEEVASCSQTLAEGASEQAASLEETASAMEEISAMAHRNSGSAGEASRLSAGTGAAMEKADDSMRKLVGQMNEISGMGVEIGKIIKTIDEIAFQTNLLALNAAVEAARAGEAGAGFAVVADEVRNLAQRAADAARSTSTLIEETIRRIGEGRAIVETTESDFVTVRESVKTVTELSSEVACASDEQSRGVHEVGAAMTRMDGLTQQNAASAEQIAASSEEMNSQAVALQGVVVALSKLVDGENAVGAPADRASDRSEVAPARPRLRLIAPARLRLVDRPAIRGAEAFEAT